MQNIKRLNLAVLVGMVLFPLVVLLANDVRYNQVISGLCRADEPVAPACDYPERYTMENGLSTAFYRHLRTYMGGPEGTSWSFEDYMVFLEYDSGDNQAASAAREAMAKIRQFNLYFVLSTGVSIVIASSATTLLVWRLVQGHRLHRNASPNNHPAPSDR